MRRSSLQGMLRLGAVGFFTVFVALAGVGAIGSAWSAEPEVAAAEGAEVGPADLAPERIELGAGSTDTPVSSRLMSALGIFGFIGIAWAMSTNRKAIDWRLVAIGTGLQLAFAVLILKTEVGAAGFALVGGAFETLLGFTSEGSKLIFGSFVGGGQVDGALINFAFAVLPTIIFFSSLMAVLYHAGVMQLVVNAIAAVMQRTMRTSGSETLSAAGNIFVGQTEAPLLVRPFVDKMTLSELMAVMTGGFATVAGGVMASYIQFLSPYFTNIAGHLMAASVMSAPAALVIAKIMVPETEESETRGGARIGVERLDANIVDAAARGASEGMTLALNVAAMLLAFVALVAALNYLIALPSYVQHGAALRSLLTQVAASGASLPAELAARCDVAAGAVVRLADRAACIADVTAAVPSPPEVSVADVFSLQRLFGYVFWPIALLMGVPPSECSAVGALLGTKMALNEFVAYLGLVDAMQGPSALSPRSGLITAYALCGFANFGSIGIQIGGIGGLAPARRRDLAKLGMRAMIAGSLAAFMTATIAGVLL